MVSPQEELLLDALSHWCKRESTCSVGVSSYGDSCAQLVITVDDLQQPEKSSVYLGEWLRVLELVTRVGVDPRAFHRAVASPDADPDTAPECSFGDRWCSYCDGVDRRVGVTLESKEYFSSSGDAATFSTILRRGIFEWDETMASSEYSAVQDAVSRVLHAQSAATTTTNVRRHAINVKLSLRAQTHASWDGRCRNEELQSLLQWCALEPRGDAALFQIVSIAPNSLDMSLVDMIAASRIPIVLEDCYDWKRCLVVRKPTDNDGDNDDNDVKTSVLATATVVKLEAYVANHSRTSQLAERLYHVLQTHSRQMKNLYISHGNGQPFSIYDRTDQEDARRVEEMQIIARGLFGSDSTLRLDSLHLDAPINERDLHSMIAVFDQQAQALHHVDAVRHHKVVLWGWELSTIRGATLAQLLRLSGGVESLELGSSSNDGISIMEIPALVRGCPSLRSLTLEAKCAGWDVMPPPVAAAVVDADSNIETSQLKHLELRLSDQESALVTNGVERLLGHIGRSLVTLRILPRRSAVTLDASLATVIARHCPNLEELTVQHADDGFIEQLFSVYTVQPCRLTRLKLVAGRAIVTYDAVMAALSTPTHPVTRVLRSLSIDVRCWVEEEEEEDSSEDEDEGWGEEWEERQEKEQKEGEAARLSTRLRHLLTTNSQLRDLTLCVGMYSPVDNTVDASRVGGWSVHLPPLRQRLATLSVLRELDLPVSLLTSILSMAGRRGRRYRVEQGVVDSDGYSSSSSEEEEEEDEEEEEEDEEQDQEEEGGDE